MANGTQDEKAIWQHIVDDLGMIINGIGLFGNVLVMITIVISKFKPRKTCIMICHQAVIDFVVCIISSVKFVYDKLPETGNIPFDIFSCYVWNSKLLYWVFVLASVYSLVFLSADRYLAVKKAVWYRTIKIRSYIISNLAFYPVSILINAPVLLDTVDFRNGHCYSSEKDYGKTIGIYVHHTVSFRVVGMLWLVLIYFLPSAVIIALYAITLKALNATTKSKDENQKKISSQLTKSAVVVTALFMVSFSIDTIYYMLGFFEIIVLDDLKNPVNRVASLFLNFHSISPFIYCLALDSFRQRICALITCGKKPMKVTPETNTVCRETTRGEHQNKTSKY